MAETKTSEVRPEIRERYHTPIDEVYTPEAAEQERAVLVHFLNTCGHSVPFEVKRQMLLIVDIIDKYMSIRQRHAEE